MTKLIVVLIIGLSLEAVGVVWLNKGLKEVGDMAQVNPTEIWRMVVRSAKNRHIWQGMICETLFFGCLLYLMKHGDVSFVWPLTALGFVLTTLAAKYLLYEEVSALRWFGVALIVAGAGVITYTEKAKQKGAEKANPPAVSTPTPTPTPAPTPAVRP